MNRFKKRAATVAASAAVAVGTVVVGGATLETASAETCTPYSMWTAATGSGSAAASSGCTGLVAHQADRYAIQIKGQYRVDGVWKDSSLSAKWVYATGDAAAQVVGQTIDGRLVRGKRVGGTNDYVLYTL